MDFSQHRGAKKSLDRKEDKDEGGRNVVFSFGLCQPGQVNPCEGCLSFEYRFFDMLSI